MSARTESPAVPPTLAGAEAAGASQDAPAAEGLAEDGYIVRAFGPRVLVRRLEPASVTAGGILLLEDAREPTHLALVVSVGPGARARDGRRIPPDVKPGDTVLLHLLAGRRSEVRQVVESGGEECTFVHHADILGILAPGATLTVTLARA